ncbi:MAG: hypothetical protein ACLFN9_04090, partial [Desulfococcaceae bacterium]
MGFAVNPKEARFNSIHPSPEIGKPGSSQEENGPESLTGFDRWNAGGEKPEQGGFENTGPSPQKEIAANGNTANGPMLPASGEANRSRGKRAKRKSSRKTISNSS